MFPQTHHIETVVLFGERLQTGVRSPILYTMMRELGATGLRGVSQVTRPLNLIRIMPAEGTV